MDLDRFEKEFRVFKARVLPMLEEYEAHKGRHPDISPELWAEIHAPLKPAAETPTEAKDGPSLEKWLAAGYKAKDYPPAPYPMVDTTQEQLDAAIAAETAAGG